MSTVIGQPVTRIDGRLKVTGGARYAADHVVPGVAYGVGVASTIGRGRIRALDASAAAALPGVLAVLHHGNAQHLFRPAGRLEEMSRAGESRPPFEDDVVYYNGQFVALVIADTLERARDAASQVKVEYDAEEPTLSLGDATPTGPPAVQYARGDAEHAFARAAIQLDETYVTPVETHNPMELHATIASWRGDELTLYETTQGVVNHHHVAAQVLDLPLESIEVVSPFVGSGFGSKLFPWPHSFLAAIGARHVGRPVKVVVPRRLMFTTVGHRPQIRHRVRLGADRDGKLEAALSDVLQHTSMIDDYVENCTEPTAMLYSCPNVAAVQHIAAVNVGTPTPMRGPGRTPALFALESALDELAFRAGIDPVELRVRNHADVEETTGRPWSSKHLLEAYRVGAERFGWGRRDPRVGAMRRGDEVLGWGMATCTWPAVRRAAEVRVRLLADGTARASCATQDIGTGTYTVFAQVVADKTGLPVERVAVDLGDSTLPPGPTSGGSCVTATVLPAIAAATEQAVRAVRAAATGRGAPFAGEDAATLRMSDGRVHRDGEPPSRGVPFQDVLAARRLAGLEGRARSDGDPAARKYALHSFGAHFCEVAFDPRIARLRVTRWVAVIDAGRIINAKTGRNQILGAVVMGIGMGLLEQTVYDRRTAQPITDNLADYLVCVNADVPGIDCIFLDHPDPVINAYGARGIGEIGLTGCAAAIASAVHHATGIRVRELPIRIEDLLSA